MDILSTTIYWFCSILEIFIFVRVLASWLPIVSPNSSFMRFIHTVTEPVLSITRKLISKSIFTSREILFDISPFVTLMILQLVVMSVRGF